MNEKFENALSIAVNVGGEDYELTALSYSPIDGSFTAFYAHPYHGTAHLHIREANYETLRKELFENLVGYEYED